MYNITRLRFLAAFLTVAGLFMWSVPIEATSVPFIQAESAILMDGHTGQILYEKNPHTPMAPASITKLMTALLTIENLAPNETITFSRNAVLSIERGSSHIGMKEGETITVNDALHGLMLASANEVANGLAEAVSGTTEAFAEDMNTRALALGAENTHFTNAHGLYENDHLTCSYDMALITMELLKSDYFLEIMSHAKHQIPETNITDEIRYLHQSHKMLNPYKDPKLFREDAVAGKPGYTIKSGHTLVTVAEQNGRLLIAVTIKTDAAHLYSDTNQLLDYGFSHFHSIHLASTDYSETLPITNDTEIIGDAVISLPKDISVTLPLNLTKEDLSFSSNITRGIDSTLTLGTVVGSLNMNAANNQVYATDLVIDEIHLHPVEEASDPVMEDPVIEAQDIPSQRPFPIGLLIGAGALLIGFSLAYINKRTTMSYKEYKAMRDKEQVSPQGQSPYL